jgi:hypothetical protein
VLQARQIKIAQVKRDIRVVQAMATDEAGDAAANPVLHKGNFSADTQHGLQLDGQQDAPKPRKSE